MNKILLAIALFWGFQIHANEIDTPEFLYKILSVNDWADSQDEPNLLLSEDDEEFIHFSKDDQVDRILNKYWENKSAVVLKIDTIALEGDMVYEANPGGSAKYFHLYNGEIPLHAVVDVTPWQ